MSEKELVTQLLKKQNIAFSMCEPENLMASASTNLMLLATGVLIQDDYAPVMLYVPADALIDIERLSAATKKSYSPIATSIVEAKYVRTFPQKFPPVAELFQAKVIADESLKRCDDLCFALDNGSCFVRIPKDEFTQLVPEDGWYDFVFNPLEYAARSTEQKNEALTSFLGVTHYTETSLKEDIEQTHELPVMSQTAREILRIQSDPGAEIEDLAKVVEQSPTLAAQVIKWANSPYYGYPGGVKSVGDAIIKVLGFDLVLNLALGLALGDKFKTPIDGPIGLNNFWKHALYTAALQERLVKLMPAKCRPKMGIAYLTGLLHNFGYLLLGELYPAHFDKLNTLLEANPHLTQVHMEDYVLGVRHTELGAWLLEAWSMPDEVIDCNRYHHHGLEHYPEEATCLVLVNTAITILRQYEIGDASTNVIPEENLKYLKISRDKLEESLTEFEEEFECLQEIAQQLVKAATA